MVSRARTHTARLIILAVKVVQLHNRYLNLGGEDTVLELECELLRQRGHSVEQFLISNETLDIRGTLALVKAGLDTIWSQQSYRALEDFLVCHKPHILHIHNTFPQLSPSVYWAAAKLGVPVVQSLHNYRMACANALLARDGGPCEDCVGRAPLPALRHRSYRNSLPATGAVVGMLTLHRTLRTYSSKVDAYIALTEFAKSVMVRSGLPKERIYVKPNFVPDPWPTLGRPPKRDNQVVFVGRLTHEKGVDLLLEAWGELRPPNTRLVIVGDGPERIDIQRRYGRLPGVVWRGWLGKRDVEREIARSRYLIAPSRVYETFPMVLVEAFSVGTPVIAPNHGAFSELVTSDGNGLMFPAGSANDLARNLDRALRLDDTKWQRWSVDSRRTYLERCTPEANYHQLTAIYERAIEHAQSVRRGRAPIG
jgi:glycosyltransferase involved in cell wall biosynthesis